MKVAIVVGARPEFVQVGTLTRAITSRFASLIDLAMIHTGQHYDRNMSEDFFERLGLPDPVAYLGVGSVSPGEQLGAMIGRLDGVLRQVKPDVVMVLGDTNSTLAGALTSSKLRIPLAHVESGLRSFNLEMPEEVNRRITDHLASLLFCPSDSAAANLAAEGISEGVHITGDVMYNAMLHTLGLVDDPDAILASYGVEAGGYAVATVHRSENTDRSDRLAQIMGGISDVASEGLPVLFPIHPRTRGRIDRRHLHSEVRVVDPTPHTETLTLVRRASVLLTDSGGLQKEAYWLATPCVTMRDETEWIETVAAGWNVLAGADRSAISSAAVTMASRRMPDRSPLYGEGSDVAGAILSAVLGREVQLTAEAS